MLSLGNLGWIQIADFIATELLALLCAVGLRQRRWARYCAAAGLLAIALIVLGSSTPAWSA